MSFYILTNNFNFYFLRILIFLVLNEVFGPQNVPVFWMTIVGVMVTGNVFLSGYFLGPWISIQGSKRCTFSNHPFCYRLLRVCLKSVLRLLRTIEVPRHKKIIPASIKKIVLKRTSKYMIEHPKSVMLRKTGLATLNTFTFRFLYTNPIKHREKRAQNIDILSKVILRQTKDTYV